MMRRDSMSVETQNKSKSTREFRASPSEDNKRFFIKKKDRAKVMNKLRILHGIKHLKNGPSKEDKVWNNSCDDALTEFIGTIENINYDKGFNSQIHEALRERVDNLHFRFHILNHQDFIAKAYNWSNSHNERERSQNSYGELPVALRENIVIEIIRTGEKLNKDLMMTLDIIDDKNAPLNKQPWKFIVPAKRSFVYYLQTTILASAKL